MAILTRYKGESTKSLPINTRPSRLITVGIVRLTFFGSAASQSNHAVISLPLTTMATLCQLKIKIIAHVFILVENISEWLKMDECSTHKGR